MISLKFDGMSMADAQHYLQHAVAPRPIALVSSINKAGHVNLSPFSFFNLVSIKPPIVVFSPLIRMRDQTAKHTMLNADEHPELVINIVDEDILQQVNLASADYPQEISEFGKAGLTREPALVVKCPMVKESKIKLECSVLEVKPLGDGGGSGNLVICEVQVIHMDKSVLDEQHRLVQEKIRHVSRLGADWYGRVDASNLFKVRRPSELPIGFDGLPETIRKSSILTGNDLGQLANVNEIPAIDPSFDNARLKNIVQYYSLQPSDMERELHSYAKSLLAEGKLQEAWQVLLAGTDRT